MRNFKKIITLAKPFIEWTFDDVLSTERSKQVPNDYNPNVTENKYVPHLENIPCKVSYSMQSLKTDNPKNSYPDINPVMETIKFFVKHDVDIKKGDKVYLTVKDVDGSNLKTHEGFCNEPHSFSTHQEVFIYQEGEA